MARGGTEEEKAAAWPPWLTARAEEEEAAARPPWPAATQRKSRCGAASMARGTSGGRRGGGTRGG